MSIKDWPEQQEEVLVDFTLVSVMGSCQNRGLQRNK
jgi:hypothetical protein